MPIPDVFDLTLPVLRKLSDSRDWSTFSLMRELAPDFRLTTDELERRNGNGKGVFYDRVQWARTWLKKADLIDYPAPNRSQITSGGFRLLAATPPRLDRWFLAFLHAELSAPAVHTEESLVDGETLEDELRRLCGPAVRDDAKWDAVRRLNGWGAEPPATYERVAALLGLETQDLLRLGRSCRISTPVAAPLLDAALALALEHPHQDPDELSLELALAGVTRDAFSLPGLCEAARRLGRHDQWRRLVRYLSENRGRGRRPRPFESWFELDVFLFVDQLGYEVRPQRTVGPYRVDLLLPDMSPQLVIECDGDRYHDGHRADQDRKREEQLRVRGYNVLRLKYSNFKQRPQETKQALEQELERLKAAGSQLKLA